MGLLVRPQKKYFLLCVSSLIRERVNKKTCSQKNYAELNNMYFGRILFYFGYTLKIVRFRLLNSNNSKISNVIDDEGSKT